MVGRKSHKFELEPRAIELKSTTRGLGNDVGVIEDGYQAEKLQEDWELPVTPPRATLPLHLAFFRLMKSPRAAAWIMLTFMWGFQWDAQVSMVVLHMKGVWGLNPRQAGIALISAALPEIFGKFFFFFLPRPQCILTTYTVGRVFSEHLVGKFGAGPVGCLLLLFSLPSYGLSSIDGSFPVFLTLFTLGGDFYRDFLL